MKQMIKKELKRNQKHILAIGLACIMTATAFIPNVGFLSAHATISTPQEINDLGYLGRGVNLLRDINVNDKSDDLLAQNGLKVLLDERSVSDFNVSKDPISSSFGQGYTSRDFASLAVSIGVDLSTKASANTDFVIGSAKLEAGFDMSVDVSTSTSMEMEYTIYNYQKYLDSWTLNWDNGGIKGNAATIRNALLPSVYGALTDSYPQFTWSPADFFEEYGTHIITSYKRGGEYTYTSVEFATSLELKEEFKATEEVSMSGEVSSFSSASFKEKVETKQTMDGRYESSKMLTSTFSRGSSKGQLDESSVDSVNKWGDGVDNDNAQVLSSGLTLVAIWDLLPSSFAARKTELQNYYNEMIADKSDDILNKFIYKSVNTGDVDFSEYDAVISNAGQLDKIRNNISGGYITGNYILACDIDLSNFENWQPIGSKSTPFRGTFDGNGNTIFNLNITSVSEPFVGLFGFNTGIIKNVSIEGKIAISEYEISQNDYLDETGKTTKFSVGGIAGYNNGTIQNCQNRVIIDSTLQNETYNVSTSDEVENAPRADVIGLFANAKIIVPTDVVMCPKLYRKLLFLI